MNPKWLAVGARLLPYIIAAMHAVEERLPGATGAEKKAAVMAALPGIIELVEGAAGRDLVDDARFIEQVSQFIDIVVMFENTVGAVLTK